MTFIVEKYFNKKFYFENKNSDEIWSLPIVNKLTEACIQSDYQKELKENLNKVKSELNDFALDKWHQHTKFTHPGGKVYWKLKEKFNPELLTQAWCKLHDIICTFELVPNTNFNSLHLCEAPGAFITSLNHYIKSHRPDIKWNWIGNTLNPYYEGNPGAAMIADDRFISHTLNKWNFGTDNTGDILQKHNIQFIIDNAKKMGNIMLVTADGSIDCQEDPGEQENLVATLFLSETIIALSVLEKGGAFILKNFTWFEPASVCLLYLLVCTFETIIAYKPVCSKHGNSEVYIIAINFKGYHLISDLFPTLLNNFDKCLSLEYTIFDLNDIPTSFKEQVNLGASFFYSFQVEALQYNIELYNSQINSKIKHKLNDTRSKVADYFIESFDIKGIFTDQYIVGPDAIDECVPLNMESKGSHLNHLQQSLLRNSLKTIENLNKDELCELIKSLLPTLNKINRYDPSPMTVTEKFEPILQSGKKFDSVLCSKFCRPWLLQLYDAVQNIRNKFNIIIPPINNKHTNDNISIIANNNYSTWLPQLITILKKLKIGDNLELCHMNLSSCLYVGFINLISTCFNQISIKEVTSNGICILLQNFQTKDVNLILFLHEIINFNNEKYQIHSVTPVPPLCKGELYKNIVWANHFYIKLLIKDTLEKLKQPTF